MSGDGRTGADVIGSLVDAIESDRTDLRNRLIGTSPSPGFEETPPDTGRLTHQSNADTFASQVDLALELDHEPTMDTSQSTDHNQH